MPRINLEKDAKTKKLEDILNPLLNKFVMSEKLNCTL
jgi:hypothetical protein